MIKNMMQLNPMRSSFKVQQRKVNFTPRELNELLIAVKKRRRVILRGASAGQDQWATAWRDVAKEVSRVEGIHRTDADVRKKWTYLKWEAMNTTKPHRDVTSKEVLNILKKEDVKNASLNHSLYHQDGNLKKSRIQSEQVPIKADLPKPPQKDILPPVEDDDSPICIKWNTYASNMSTVIPLLLASEKFVDVTVACDGKYIKCHKVILSACSAYFEELLSTNPCQHPIILLRDFQFWEIEAIVDFIYKGVVNIPQHKLPKLLQAANALKIKGLTTFKKKEEIEQTEDTRADCDELDKPASASPSAVTPVTNCKSLRFAKRISPTRSTKKNEPSHNQSSDPPDKFFSSVTVKEEPFQEMWEESSSCNLSQFEALILPGLSKVKQELNFQHFEDDIEDWMEERCSNSQSSSAYS